MSEERYSQQNRNQNEGYDQYDRQPQRQYPPQQQQQQPQSQQRQLRQPQRQPRQYPQDQQYPPRRQTQAQGQRQRQAQGQGQYRTANAQSGAPSGPAPYRPRQADARRSKPRQSPSYYQTNKPIGSLNSNRRRRRPTPFLLIVIIFVLILLIVLFTSKSCRTMFSGNGKGGESSGDSGSQNAAQSVESTDAESGDATGTDENDTTGGGDVAVPPEDGSVIFIDPGHGFEDGGASSEYMGDYNERDITLMVAKEAVEILKARGYNVQLTHDGVNFPIASTDNGDKIFSAFGAEKNERSVYVNEHNVGLFVSLHCDALPSDTSVSGTRIHFCDDYAYTDEASSFADALIDKIGSSFSGGRSVKKFGHTPDDSYNVTRFVDAPSVLIEMGFVTNESDAQLLLDSEWRSKMAAGVADGIAAFLAGRTAEE